MEIRSGTGGDEAAIFAGDLLRMYELYAEKMKWSFNVISYTQGTVGGYKEIVCGVEGEDVYGVIPSKSLSIKLLIYSTCLNLIDSLSAFVAKISIFVECLQRISW